MVLQDELNNTIENLRRTRKAILGRGGEITETAGLKELPEAIYKIPADASLAYQTDETTAYRKIVPTGAQKYAQISKIGGMTYKSNNLLPYPFAFTSVTDNGVTFTANQNQSITIKGTSTEVASATLVETGVFSAKAGETFTISYSGNWGNQKGYVHISERDASNIVLGNTYVYTTAKTITIEKDCYLYIRIGIKSGVTLDETITITLNRGDTEMPWEPFFEGLRDSKVTSLASEGANLLDISKAVNKNFVDNGDGTYTLICTDNNNRFSAKVALNIPANSTITIKATHISGDGKVVMRFTNSDGTDFMHIAVDKYVRTYTIPKDLARMDFYMNASDAGKSVTISEVQVQYGTVTEYKQYIGTLSTFEIPETVQSLEGYGEGVSADYYNRIEWRNGRCYFVKKCERLVLDGSQKIDAFDLTDFPMRKEFRIDFSAYVHNYKFALDISDTVNLVATHYIPSTRNQQWKGRNEYLIAVVERFLRWNDDYMSAEEMKAKLKTWYDEGNPFTIVYALAEPIETDITDIIGVDNYIEVEGGGSIVATNEHKNAIPSKINYIYEVGG